MDFFATVHGDSSRQFNDIPVQKDSSVNLTCTAKGPKKPPSWLSPDHYYPYEIELLFNSTQLERPICTKEKHSSETCILNLDKVQPDDHGRYFCQAANRGGCTYKELNLIVTGGYSTTTGSSK